MRIKKITSVASVLLLLTAVGIVALPQTAHAQIGVSIHFNLFGPEALQPVAIAPPPLPVYVVPPPPMEGYVWTPGHWRWNGYGYFWVPGTWVQPPAVGVLWTPGYWGWHEGAFGWHEGYWGPHVGFYGGINYGGGYVGVGFVGGGWNGGHYQPNPQVINNSTNVTNVTNVTNNYNTTNNTVDNNITKNVTNNASFAGGPGGTTAQPTPEEQAAANETHTPPTQAQVQHAQAAASNPALAAANNHGKPAIAATSKPGDFTHNVVAARAAGPANPEAEQHNIQVKHNPEMAKGAALPKPRPDQPHAAAAQHQANQEKQQQRQLRQQQRQNHLNAEQPKPAEPQAAHPAEERPAEERAPEERREGGERPGE